MLTITRKFTVGYNPKSADELKQILNTFDIVILGTGRYETMIDNKPVLRLYVHCEGDAEKFELLVKHLQYNFAGIVSIQY